jgi:hypothetical protein
VEFDWAIPAPEAAETPATSNPAASATDICFLMVIYLLSESSPRAKTRRSPPLLHYNFVTNEKLRGKLPQCAR